MEFNKEILKLLYNSKVKIFLERFNLFEDVKHSERALSETQDYFHAGEPESAVKMLREFYKMTSVLENRRDEDLAKFLTSLQKSSKGRNIACSIGSGHTLLYHLLMKFNAPVRRIFPYMPYQFDLRSENLRKHLFGVGKFDDILALQDIAAGEIYRYLERTYSSNHERHFHADNIAKQLTESEIKDFSKHMSENWWPELGKEIFIETIGDWLAEKGFV